MSEPEPLRLFGELKNKIAEYDVMFGDVISPQVAHEKERAAIRARISELWAQLPTIKPTDVWKAQEEIVKLGGQLREAEIRHERDLENNERLYRLSLEGTFNSLSDAMMKIMALWPSFRQPSLQGPERRLDDSTTPLRHKRRKLYRNKTDKALWRTTRNRRRRLEDDATSGQQDSEGITNPVPGNLYLAFRDMTNEWVPVVLLPMTHLEHAGISGTLETLGLTEALPSCYQRDELTGEYMWCEGYKDGQPLVAEREFPVMYFDNGFPVKSPVGWVAPEELREFNVATATFALVPYLGIVQKFLRKRALGESLDGGGEPSRDRDAFPDVEDHSQQATSSAQNRFQQTMHESVASEIVVAPTTLTTSSHPMPGATLDAQPFPQTSTGTVQFGSGVALEAEPNEPTAASSTQFRSITTTETRSAQQKSIQSASGAASTAEAQPTSRTSAGSTVSTTAVGAQSTTQQPTNSAPDATTSTETSTGTNSVPNTTTALDTNTSTSEVCGSSLKVEPDIEIISIVSSEPEEENNEDSGDTGPIYTEATLRIEGSASPERQAGVVEEARSEGNTKGQPHQRTQSQTEDQTPARPGEGPSGLFQAPIQAKETPRASLTVSTATTTPHTAPGSDQAVLGAARRQIEASISRVVVDPAQVSLDRGRRQSEATARPRTSGNLDGTAPDAQRYQGQTAFPASSARPCSTHQPYAEEAAHVALAALQYPNSETLAHSQLYGPPRYGSIQSSTAGSQPTTQTLDAGFDPGSTHTPLVDRVPPSFPQSPQPNQFTPVNLGAASNTAAPPAGSVILPPLGTMPGQNVLPHPEPPQSSTDVSNNGQDLGNYGIIPAQQPSDTPAAGYAYIAPRQSNSFMHHDHWSYKLPPSLITYLEGYLLSRNAPISLQGLLSSDDRYLCPFCTPPKQTAYIRVPSFVSHLTRHWQAVESYVTGRGVVT